MRITASHIIHWVETYNKEAQTNLPRLIRRLCFIPSDCKQLSFPAGDSSFVPGWDGVLFSTMGNAWVPAGSSYWEMGCDKNITSKANSDFEKRVTSTTEDTRKTSTFVFVTPRRWSQKADWLKTQRARNLWSGVHVYDADDLEQWLEQSPGVALQFAEELSLSGPSICSPDRFWSNWANQCAPAIAQQALLADRSSTLDSLKNKLQGITEESAGELLPLQADSTEEAAAFAVATVLQSNLQNFTAIVLQPEGWRYVEANPQLRIAIAANTNAAQSPVQRTGLLVIVPSAKGNAPSAQQPNALSLERPSIYSFRDSLIAMNMEESDARRFAAVTGRSWSIFRRQRAINPAITQPSWLDNAHAPCLPLLCLLGSWNGSNVHDQQIVERLAARPYADIEAQLCQLAALDDAPVLRIDRIWKAKSPLELLGLCANRITAPLLARFLEIAREMLELPDPQLELPESERHMAQIHGKVHPFSGLLSEAICDSLIKLAVRGSDFPALQGLNIEGGISQLVEALLQEAEAVRWLSLSGHLPALAEAAPDAFLRAVETSLRQQDQPVTRLLTETAAAGAFGRCWYAGLLWALESIAWNPRYLLRVAMVLASLTRTPIQGNWSNNPANSLYGLFLCGRPMTAAKLQQRIQVLDQLVQRHEEPAFAILIRLLSSRPEMVMSAHPPRWRDDDAGTLDCVTDIEAQQMLQAAKDRALQLAAGQPLRITKLLRETRLKKPPELIEVLHLASALQPEDDEGKEKVRGALRSLLYWHRNYSKEPADQLEKWLSCVEETYLKLEPVDLVIGNRWLFASDTLGNLPQLRDDDFEKHDQHLLQISLETLARLKACSGMKDIERLIQTCADPASVGFALAKADWQAFRWAEWIASIGDDFRAGQPFSLCIYGLLCGLPPKEARQILMNVLQLASEQGWTAERQADFLNLAGSRSAVWGLEGGLPTEVANTYWQKVQLHHWSDDASRTEIIQRLLLAKRPRAALACCGHRPSTVAPELLLTCLQGFVSGQEAEGIMPSSWHLSEIIQHLEQAEEISRNSLAQLEFALFHLIEYDMELERLTLFDIIMSQPDRFSELVSLVYKPHSQLEADDDEPSHHAVWQAYRVLLGCRKLPGTLADGSINASALSEYVQKVIELLTQSDRLIVGELMLGGILAHSPSDEDGTWPCLAVRNVLDDPDREKMRNGFCTGTRNKRGVTGRLLTDGGTQERHLAAHYRELATRIQCSHPYVADALEQIARSYEHEAHHHDLGASLSKERY